MHLYLCARLYSFACGIIPPLTEPLAEPRGFAKPYFLARLILLRFILFAAPFFIHTCYCIRVLVCFLLPCRACVLFVCLCRGSYFFKLILLFKNKGSAAFIVGGSIVNAMRDLGTGLTSINGDSQTK